MKTPSLVIAAFILGTASLSGLGCNQLESDKAAETEPGVENADVAALTASRQMAFAEAYAAQAANLRASLEELRRFPGKEPQATLEALTHKIEELEGMSRSMRALAAQTQALVRAAR